MTTDATEMRGRPPTLKLGWRRRPRRLCRARPYCEHPASPWKPLPANVVCDDGRGGGHRSGGGSDQEMGSAADGRPEKEAMRPWGGGEAAAAEKMGEGCVGPKRCWRSRERGGDRLVRRGDGGSTG
jgi:hypothetical protein